MIPNMSEAKLYRIDTINNTLLVWFGGVKIKEYTLNGGKEMETYEIERPYRKDFPSFLQVKTKMHEIIKEGERKKQK